MAPSRCVVWCQVIFGILIPWLLQTIGVFTPYWLIEDDINKGLFYQRLADGSPYLEGVYLISNMKIVRVISHNHVFYMIIGTKFAYCNKCHYRFESCISVNRWKEAVTEWLMCLPLNPEVVGSSSLINSV